MLVGSSASTRYSSNKTPSRPNHLSGVILSSQGLTDLPSSQSNYSTNSTHSCIQLETPGRRLGSCHYGSTRLERAMVSSVNPGMYSYLIWVNLVKSRYTNGIPVTKPSWKLTKNPMQLVQPILVAIIPLAHGLEQSRRLKWNSLSSVSRHHPHYIPINSRYLSLPQALVAF